MSSLLVLLAKKVTKHEVLLSPLWSILVFISQLLNASETAVLLLKAIAKPS